MSDNEITFEEACEFMEQASSQAGQELIIEMLGDALNELHLLRDRVEALEMREALFRGKQMPPQYTRNTTFPAIKTTNTSRVIGSVTDVH